MPYFVYQIQTRDELGLVRELECLSQFDAFREAKDEARRLRRDAPLEGVIYKVIFAETRLEAEERLLEKREKPVLMEYER